MSPIPSAADRSRWYAGITRYQWLVLVIASLGWVFDVFEGQIFVASMQEAMKSLVPSGTPEGRVALFNNVALGAFLLGGAVGGIVFGILSDRLGRKRTMSLTILFYSVFTCLSAFSQQWWHLAGMRFLVALGVGGEWAVASALVAEVFPSKARAHVGSMFHASSVFGTYLAITAGTFLIGNSAVGEWSRSSGMAWTASIVDPATLPWRLGFLLGGLPALLIIWIRRSLRESDSWHAVRQKSDSGEGPRLGNIRDLFQKEYRKYTLVGVTLAASGLATFWGVHIYGKNVLQSAVEQSLLIDEVAPQEGWTRLQRVELLRPYTSVLKRSEMLGMFLVTTGGGLGLVAFGPISVRLGRRGTFLLFHAGGLISAWLVFRLVADVTTAIVVLPIFGFLTLGMHAGYAIYFPELYPTQLRGTGTGFCFNAGRLLAAPILFSIGWLQNSLNYSIPQIASLVSVLFAVGAMALVFAPETHGLDLK